MVNNKDKGMVSCFQCQGIYFCYGSKDPTLNRNQAREAAAKCNSYHKGFPVETVYVYGYKRGMSRKNAEKLILNGIARWIDHRIIELIETPPRNIRSRLFDNDKNSQH